MDNETGIEFCILRNLKDTRELDYEEIQSELLGQSLAEGYYTFDNNYAGLPNIYLRGLYKQEDLIGSVYLLFVKPLEQERG